MYTLADLQATLNKFGPAHFNANAQGAASNPLKFAIVLVLSLQYEQAIQYLFSVEGAQADAVHMALAAMLAGVLHVSAATPTDSSAGLGPTPALGALPPSAPARARISARGLHGRSSHARAPQLTGDVDAMRAGTLGGGGGG